jgi:hypothetical protein
VVGGFQVGRRAVAIEDGVACVHQGRADAQALPAGADSQDCQVLVCRAVRVMLVERGVQGLEPG